jgi:cytochrome c556
MAIRGRESMNRLAVAFGATLILALTASSFITPSTGQAPADDGSQAAFTSQVETTFARRLIMLSIGSNNDMLHDMLDGVLPLNELEFRGRLDSMRAMLYAFPSLYRQQPNPYTEEGAAADAARVSLATSAVWEDFETFKQMAYDASMKAKMASEGLSKDFLAQVEELEVMCESCHEAYRESFEEFESLENSIK